MSLQAYASDQQWTMVNESISGTFTVGTLIGLFVLVVVCCHYGFTATVMTNTMLAYFAASFVAFMYAIISGDGDPLGSASIMWLLVSLVFFLGANYTRRKLLKRTPR